MAKEIIVKVDVESGDLKEVEAIVKKLNSSSVKLVDTDNLDEAAELTETINSSFTSFMDKLTGGAYSKLTGALATAKNTMTSIVTLSKEWFVSIKGATVAETALNAVRSIGLGIVTAINIASGGLFIIIGTIVTAVIGLVAYFTRGEEGTNRMKKAWEGVKIVFDKLLDATTAYAKLLYHTVTLNWDAMKKDLNDIKDSTLGIGDALERQNKLSDERAALDKEERKWLVEKKKLENESEKARLKSRDADKYSAEERKQFLQEAMDIEDEIAQRDIEIATKKYENLRAQNALATSSKEDMEAEAKAEAEVSRLETVRLKTKRRMTNEMVSLNKEIRRDGKKAADDKLKSDKKIHDAKVKQIKEERDAYIQAHGDMIDAAGVRSDLEAAKIKGSLINADGSNATDAQLDAAAEAEKKRLIAEADFKIMNTKLTNDEVLLIEQNLANDLATLDAEKAQRKKEAREKEIEDEKRHQQQMVDLTSDALSSIADLAEEFGEKGFKASKALRIAETIMSTAAAVMAVWADSRFGGPIAKSLATAAVVATGIKQLMTIKNTKYNGDSASGPNPSKGGNPIANVSNSNPSMNGRQLDAVNRNNEMMKAYVVYSDLEAKQKQMDYTKSVAGL